MDVSKHITKAEDALRKKNFDFAVGFLQQVLSLQPDHGEARALMCRALRMRGERKPTAPWLAKVVGSPHLFSALLCRLTRSPAGRARALEKYFKLEPTSAGVHLDLGDALAAAGHFRSAIAVFEDLGEVEPDRSDAWRLAAACHAQVGQIEEALECLEKALKADPRDSEADRMRKNLSADATLRKGTYERATSSRELMRDRDQVRNVEKEARIHRTQEELEEESEQLRSAVTANPEDGRSRRGLAEILARREEYQEAIRILEEGRAHAESTAELDDQIGDYRMGALHREIAKLEARFQKQKSEGVKADLDMLREELQALELSEYQRRVATHPTDLSLWYALGKAQQAAGSLDEAIGAFQKSVKDPKTRLDSLTRLGACFFGKGLYDLAEKQLSAALEETTPSTDRGKSVLYNLGLIAEKAERSQNAFDYFSRIYEVDIHYRDVAERIEALRG